MEEEWRRKVEALRRLAEDQAGKPEGELARQKAEEIIAKHGDSAFYQAEYPGLWQILYQSYSEDVYNSFIRAWTMEAAAETSKKRYDMNARLEIWNEATKRWEPI